MLKRIENNEFKRIYEQIKKDAPAYRVKSFVEYKTLLKDEKYQCFSFEQDNREIGFVIGYIFQNDKSQSYPKRFGFFHMDYLNIYLNM